LTGKNAHKWRSFGRIFEGSRAIARWLAAIEYRMIGRMEKGGPVDQLANLADKALERTQVHTRVAQQGLWPNPEAQLSWLRAACPYLPGFPDREYHDVLALLDWDHRLPSQTLTLRLFASYSAESRERVQKSLASHQQRIAEDDLFPEFDVPDFNAVVADEVYVLTYDVKDGSATTTLASDKIRFYSDWRREVSRPLVKSVLRSLESNELYNQAKTFHEGLHLGDAIVVGWTPPCVAKTKNWAIEVWLVTAFEGRFGKARVFMVDTADFKLSHTFLTEIQIAA
jgi:hypothetical protein